MSERRLRRAACLCAVALAGCSDASAVTPRRAPTHRARAPAPAETPSTAPLPAHSIFHLQSTWTDQRGRPMQLSSLRGKPTVVLLFYGTCRSVCPTLIEDAKRIDAALSADVRRRVQYLLVTFDPANDTTARLGEIAREHRLDTRRFCLVRSDDDAVRELANVLGVQYREIREGEYAHSSVLNLLDRDGVFAYQSVGVSRPVEEMAAHIHAMAR